MASVSSCLAPLGLIAAVLAVSPASAQALRSPSASSVAAGATADRNSVPTPASSDLPSATARQSTTTGTGSPSSVSILGIPLRAAAPVTPAYNGNAAYSTFAGQPMTGKDAVLQQSVDGAP